MEQFKLSKLPMPPSSNHQYWYGIMPGHNGGQVARPIPTKELENFKMDMEIRWKQEHLALVYKARQKTKEWLLQGKYIGVDTIAAFEYFDLFTQKGTPRRMDATNRIKALHDSLATVLEIDDSWFWESTIVKRETKSKTPWCAVILYPVEHLSITDMKVRGLL